MEITTSLNPQENCNKGQISGGKPEMSDYQLDRLVFYVQTLAVPARRNLDVKEVIEGEKLFEQVNCSSCHTPKFTTGKHKIKILENQKIQPFSDLLLHDMGEDLADNRPDNLANGKEWRTAPLWGIGLTKTVNRHSNFLHDGRARNVEEAILWHGGEAEKSRDAYKNLSKNDREKLIRFVESL